MALGIEAIAAAQAGMTAPAVPLIEPSGAQVWSAQSVSAPGTFANMMQTRLGELDANVGAAETALRDLAAGKAVQPQDVMITMERARISVLTFLQLRNKLVESYQDVMRMQL